ncbi:MAG: hypothetical protein ACREQV_03920, partial [Candidatus Binatia bacterium]
MLAELIFVATNARFLTATALRQALLTFLWVPVHDRSGRTPRPSRFSGFTRSGTIKPEVTSGANMLKEQLRMIFQAELP